MKYLFLLTLIIIITILVTSLACVKHSELYESTNNEYDCVISINVHEKFPFLLNQIDNIKKNIACSYCIILNCNDYMFKECNDYKLFDSNIYIHPEILNKKYVSGLITQGIYKNMYYSLKNINFKYFIVASSKNMFGNSLSLKDLQSLVPYPEGTDTEKHVLDPNNLNLDWHWSILSQTKLAKYYLANNKRLYSSAHEGLCFPYNTCKTIVDFLESHVEIRDDIPEAKECAEEFALQTIAMNEKVPFYYIGNGIHAEESVQPNTEGNNIKKFMYKVPRV